MSRRLTFFITLAILHALGVGSAHSQTFYFSDGRKASMPEAKIQGSDILVPLALSGAEQGSAVMTLPISSLIRIDWPAPAAIAEAEASLKADKPAEALKKIDSVLSQQEVLRKVPGSWWSQGAVIKAISLAKLGKENDANAMIETMRRAEAPDEDISRAEVAVIDHLVSTGKTDAAGKLLDKLQKTVTNSAGLASIAVTRGKILEQAGKTDEALLSFLRVPVLYTTEEDMMPAALAGAARAFKEIGDDTRADEILTTLTTRFPDSPEAIEAKR